MAWSLFDHRSFSYIVQGWWLWSICTCQTLLLIWHFVQPIRNRQRFKTWLLRSSCGHRLLWLNREQQMSKIVHIPNVDMSINIMVADLFSFDSLQCWLVFFVQIYSINSINMISTGHIWILFCCLLNIQVHFIAHNIHRLWRKSAVQFLNREWQAERFVDFSLHIVPHKRRAIQWWHRHNIG